MKENPELVDIKLVLIVDDMPEMGGLVAELLAVHNPDVKVIIVENCKQAIAMVQERQFDLVLMDLYLIGESGLDCLAEIRRINPELPVVMLTAEYDRTVMASCYKAGADDYLIKMNAPRFLPHVVVSAIERRRGTLAVEHNKEQRIETLNELKELTG